MRAAPASREFSSNSFTIEAGRSTTSPAAILLATCSGRTWIRPMQGQFRRDGEGRQRHLLSKMPLPPPAMKLNLDVSTGNWNQFSSGQHRFIGDARNKAKVDACENVWPLLNRTPNALVSNVQSFGQYP